MTGSSEADPYFPDMRQQRRKWQGALVTVLGLASVGSASAAVVVIAAQLGASGRPRAPSPPPGQVERARLAPVVPIAPAPAPAPAPALATLPADELAPLSELERELAEARIAATLLRGRLLEAELRLAAQESELALLRPGRPIAESVVRAPAPAAAAAPEPHAEALHAVPLPAEAASLPEQDAPLAAVQMAAAPLFDAASQARESEPAGVEPVPEPFEVALLDPGLESPGLESAPALTDPLDPGGDELAPEPANEPEELALVVPPPVPLPSPPPQALPAVAVIPLPIPPSPPAPGDNAAGLPRAPVPPAAPGATRVFIHHHDRPTDAGAMANTLPAGIVLAEIRPVRATPERPAVRFYHSADRAPAEALARALAGRTGLAYRAYDFSWFRPPAQPGTLEVWISAALSLCAPAHS